MAAKFLKTFFILFMFVDNAYAGGYSDSITVINNSHCTMTQIHSAPSSLLLILDSPSPINLGTSDVMSFETKPLSLLNVFTTFFQQKYEVSSGNSKNYMAIHAFYYS